MRPKSSSFKTGQQIGRYELVQLLGRGGNADVWKARDQNGSPMALKLLRKLDVSSEPYKRFTREVAELRQLGAFPGVLPLLDADLPSEPSRARPAYLAMPEAEPLTMALGDTPGLEEVVNAVATVANTLARLAERGISHRDVKPANLHRYEDRWVIGDFGLVKTPDSEPLTDGSTHLGPLHFLAPEMLNSPATADGKPADVYSLAKTLWVLATRQRYPMPGEHRVDEPAHCISSFVNHSKAIYLDRLLEHATKTDPTKRPPMREVADELDAWTAEPATPTTPLDLGAIVQRITTALEPIKRPVAARERRVRLAEDALEAFEVAADTTLRSLTTCGIPVVRELHDSRKFVSRVVGWELPHGEWTGGRCMAIGHDPGPPSDSQLLGMRQRPILLWTGIGLRTTAEGRVFLGAGHALGYEWDFPLRSHFLWQDEVPRSPAKVRIPLGSALQAEAIAKLSDGLLKNLPTALNSLARVLAAGSAEDKLT
jgi:hypothetical protein